MIVLEDLSQILGLFRSVTGVLRVIWLKARAYALAIRLRFSPPIGEAEALAIAEAVLRGSVLKAKAFRDTGERTKKIAVLWRRSYRDLSARVLLLEEFAASYRIAWESGDVYLSGEKILRAFDVWDLDRDGVHEISFLSASFGTGGGLEELFLYVPATGDLESVSLEYNWQVTAEPVVQLRDGPNDRQRRRMLERVAAMARLMEPIVPMNWDDAENAAARWHRDNGPLPIPNLTLHVYPGQPLGRASVTVQLEDGETLWIAYFKGPVYGYIASREEHFVLYSPSSTYNWVACLYADQRFLWMGTHGDGIIRYDRQTRELRKLSLIHEGKPIDEVHAIKSVGENFIINGSVAMERGRLCS